MLLTSKADAEAAWRCFGGLLWFGLERRRPTTVAFTQSRSSHSSHDVSGRAKNRQAYPHKRYIRDNCFPWILSSRLSYVRCPHPKNLESHETREGYALWEAAVAWVTLPASDVVVPAIMGIKRIEIREGEHRNFILLDRNSALDGESRVTMRVSEGSIMPGIQHIDNIRVGRHTRSLLCKVFRKGMWRRCSSAWAAYSGWAWGVHSLM